VLHRESGTSPRRVSPCALPDFRFGLTEEACGTPDAGGSFCCADPVARFGFAYAMTKAGFYLWGVPREKSLRDAVYRCPG